MMNKMLSFCKNSIIINLIISGFSFLVLIPILGYIEFYSLQEFIYIPIFVVGSWYLYWMYKVFCLIKTRLGWKLFGSIMVSFTSILLTILLILLLNFNFGKGYKFVADCDSIRIVKKLEAWSNDNYIHSILYKDGKYYDLRFAQDYSNEYTVKNDYDKYLDPINLKLDLKKFKNCAEKLDIIR